MDSMTVGQQSLWALTRLTTAGDLGNLCTALRLTPQVQVERLIAALGNIYARHEILRAHLIGDVIPRLETGDLDELAFTVRTVEGWDEADRDAWLDAECRQPFSLQSRMCRFSLLLLQKSGRTIEAILLIVQHHLVSDFRSIEVITQELELLYQRQALPADWQASRSFSAFAHDETSWLASPAAQKQRDFWKARLQGLLPLKLRPHRRADTSHAFIGVERRKTLPPDVTEAVRASAKHCGVTTFTFLLAALATLLAGETRQLSFALGVTSDLRRERAYRRTVGYLVNTVPVAIRLDPDATFDRFVSLASASAAASMSHARLPFAEIARHLPLDAETHQPRTLAALFSWLKFERDFGGEGPDNLILDTLPLGRGEGRILSTSQPLELSIEDRTATFECLWVLASECFTPSRREQLMQRYDQIVRTVAADPASPLRPLLDPAYDLATRDDVRETLDL